MAHGFGLNGREQRMVFDLYDALGASLDLDAVLKDAYRILLPLVDADYGALATSLSERPEDLRWIVQDLPPSFLGSYPEMVPHDFVLRAVVSNINVVMRDSEMIDRRSLERNMMYHRAREVGAPLEQVMAVMLDSGKRFQSGLSLYRGTRRPFRAREQALLQRITPVIRNTVRNCRSFEGAQRWTQVLGLLLAAQDSAVIIVRHPAREVDRTEAATALLDAWFPSTERDSTGLPRIFADRIAEAEIAMARGESSRRSFQHRRSDGVFLEVTLFPIPADPAGASWAFKLREVPLGLPIPPRWRPCLTEREIEVVECLLRDWSVEIIADELGCEPNTVKAHRRNIFQKLGVESSRELIHRAAREAS